MEISKFCRKIAAFENLDLLDHSFLPKSAAYAIAGQSQAQQTISAFFGKNQFTAADPY